MAVACKAVLLHHYRIIALLYCKKVVTFFSGWSELMALIASSINATCLQTSRCPTRLSLMLRGWLRSHS